MRNKRLSSLMCVVLIAGNILACIPPVPVHAGIKQNVIEGSGKSPEIEVIREDENEEDPGTESYEEDISGAQSNGDRGDMITVSVSTAEDMEQLAKDCRLDTWSRDKYILLENDIVLDGSDFKYIPIFGGVFNGQGHTISGLTVSDSESYTGLFCITQEGAVIENLTVEGSLVPSGKPLATGGIAGDNYGLISDCTFNGNISGYDYSGGIAGYNEQTGMISNCHSTGYVTGMHFTGGICGYNLGVIGSCKNDAMVNMSNVDETVSIKDIDISKYTNKLLNIFGDNNKQDSTSIINSPVDAGGICGYSQGTIHNCVNNSLVGYEHVGYNIGGIVGRQNGYVETCINNGEIYGRKDVGGIAGQAEPYVMIDISKDIIGQLTSNMNTLHDLVNVTLNDAGNESDIVSARLNMVKGFTDKAINDTSYLANETEDFINGVVDSGTEVLNRIDYAMNESVKSNGALDRVQRGFSDASTAASNLTKAVDDLDIYKYMSETEKVSYNQAKKNITDANGDYKTISDTHRNNDYNYCYIKFIEAVKDTPAHSSLSSDIIFTDAAGNPVDLSTLPDNPSYNNVKVMRRDLTTNPPTLTPFPSQTGDFAASDKQLHTEAGAAAEATILVDSETDFKNKYGMPYPEYLAQNVATIEQIISAHTQEMTEETRKDARYAVEYTRQAMNDFAGAVGETKNIVSNINARGSISLPKLSDEYKNRSNSLIANIQGMSDNLGFLNNEMNTSNQQLVNDMVRVNDQFNVIMLLIADAIDGVLEQDYTDVYQDNSAQVAEECTDATIADSVNYGIIHGDINTSGVAGTMAIEYDFDLESDITGIKDAATGTTYRTKCVLRADRNDGYIEGVKNCVGGICGLQEMGTILRCQNYGKLKSKTGDYIGGISGESLGTIRDCHSKGILDGRSYIGGITGKGYDITGCYSLPAIYGTGSCLGAIAGDNDQKGRLKDNFFVSDDHAGIDRVSYSGKAEPIDYYDLISMDSVPIEFKTIRVSFIVDDKTVSVKDYNYGDSITSLPMEVSEGEYIEWNWDNARLTNMHSDAELTGKSARYVTTLASLQLRESGQSAVLVDGRFIEGDSLLVELSGASTRENIIETWKLTIPNDYSPEHLIRYCPPSNVEEIKIWTPEGDSYREIEPDRMGKYYTFSMPGNEVEFEIENVYVSPFIKYLMYEIAGAVVLTILIFIIISNRLNKKRSAKRHSPENNNDIIDMDLDDTTS